MARTGYIRWDDNDIRSVLDLHAYFVKVCIVLAHWNNSPRVDMSIHSDILSWFRANQSVLFFSIMHA